MDRAPAENYDSLPIDSLLDGFGAAVLKSIRDPFGIFGRDYKVLWVNKTLASIHRLEPEGIIGKTCYEAFHGRAQPCSDCPMGAVLETGRTQIVERWLDFPDGRRRWGEVRAYPVRGKEKTIVAIIFIVIEITDKKESIQQQKEYAEYLSRKLKENIGKDKKVDLDDGDITLKVNLSRRETDVLRLMTEGYTNTQISELLSISPNTVKSHVNHVFNKLGVNDRTQAAVLATRHHLI
ncbi:MAG: LuxR C-terminal-related transcriptional regulator [Thermodesulfobacteriota bacterium]|nr:LuxR C-terminal-related transcriptional regulator [Thermodesulfobacteriota bacterium]